MYAHRAYSKSIFVKNDPIAMPLEEKERRYKWLISQRNWHERRMGKSGWHHSQFLWYRRESKMVFTFADIVARAYRKHKKQLIENLSESNALYARIDKENHHGLYSSPVGSTDDLPGPNCIF